MSKCTCDECAQRLAGRKSDLPSTLFVWLVPNEEVLEQPGSWRIRKWDIEPFPEATHCIPSSDLQAARDNADYWRRKYHEEAK